MRRLPPLNAIRAFEAAGRHLSFTRAADELNVTPAAVSQQVRNLEEILGVVLFRRLTRALLLTEAGQMALPILGEGFDRLQDGIERIRTSEESGTLTVSAAPSFAARWLVRRLPRFELRCPDIRVRLDPTLQVVDFERENVDIAVRFGEGNYPGLRTDRLMSENISPVCSPKLITADKPLREPADLAHHVLLHTDWRLANASQPDWAMWLWTAGVENVNPSRGPMFTTEILTVESALEGNGVALVNRGIVIDEVAAGRLIWPFELTLKTKYGFFIVCPEHTADNAKNAAFREWLLDEARADGNI